MYESNPVEKGVSRKPYLPRHTDRTIESIVGRLEFIGRMAQMIATWYDQFIMGWPMILGHELEPAMKEKVGITLWSCFYYVLLDIAPMGHLLTSIQVWINPPCRPSTSSYLA